MGKILQVDMKLLETVYKVVKRVQGLIDCPGYDGSILYEGEPGCREHTFSARLIMLVTYLRRKCYWHSDSKRAVIAVFETEDCRN